MSNTMFRTLLVIALCGASMGVLLGAEIPSAKHGNEMKSSLSLSTATVLRAWSETDGTQDGIGSVSSKTGASRNKFEKHLPQNSAHAMNHKNIREVEESQFLDYEMFLENSHNQPVKKSDYQIQRQENPRDIGKIFHITDLKYHQEDINDIEYFRTKSNVVPLIEESNSSSEPSDGVLIPAILYKLQIVSSALCSEWNHKFAVFKAFVMISCLVIGLVALITLFVYFIDVKRRQNSYMKLKLLP